MEDGFSSYTDAHFGTGVRYEAGGITTKMDFPPHPVGFSEEILPDDFFHSRSKIGYSHELSLDNDQYALRTRQAKLDLSDGGEVEEGGEREHREGVQQGGGEQGRGEQGEGVEQGGGEQGGGVEQGGGRGGEREREVELRRGGEIRRRGGYDDFPPDYYFPGPQSPNYSETGTTRTDREIVPPENFETPRKWDLVRNQAAHVTTIYVPRPDFEDPRPTVLGPITGPIPSHLRYGPGSTALSSLTPLSALAPISPDTPASAPSESEEPKEEMPSGDSPRVYARSYNREAPPGGRKSMTIGDWTLMERPVTPKGMSGDKTPIHQNGQHGPYGQYGYVNEAYSARDVAVTIEDTIGIPPPITKTNDVTKLPQEKGTIATQPKKAEPEIMDAGSEADSETEEEHQKRLDEEAKWLQWMEVQFSQIAGEDGEIDLNEFKTALGVKKSFFAERFFALFDLDGSGTIEMVELMDGLRMLTKGTPKRKLKFLFDVYDVDGGGTIDFDELKTVLNSCMDESSLQLTDENLEDLTRALFESADEDGSGAITFEELVGELEKYPGVLENLTISAANWLKPPEEKKKKRFTKPRYFSKRYLLNNVKKVVFLAVYWLVNIGLFLLNAMRYKDSNIYVIIARGAGMVLNFNSVFIVVLMLRYCLTWLRSTRVGSLLPLDQSVSFHKMVGVVIAFFTFIHTVAHLINIAVVMDDARQPNTTLPAHLHHLQYWEFLFTLRSQIGWIGPGFGYISGVILDVVLLIMVICSMPFVRRGGHFQVFYWTHMLYVVFWVFLILHGPIFWYFFIVPGFLFVLERINVSKFYKLARFGHVKIKEVNLLPSRVTNLVIRRPKKFHYKPGDYIFVNIPVIAQHEWHPFTISSAPEMEDEVCLHIRSVGHWTNKLYDYFDALYVAPKEKKPAKGEVTEKKSREKKPKHRRVKANVEIFIDGPYGTSTREIFDSDHAVLIASGIGVTPYASILQSVHSRYLAYKKSCPKCDHTWYGEIPPHVMKLKKVDFIWLNRDQKCFEWFVSLLSKLEMNPADLGLTEEEEEAAKFISMHLHITSALGRHDMKGIGLHMAMDILYKKEGRDLLTGLKCRTQAGRPDWHELFGKINARKKGKVNVFFCGSPQLAKSLKVHCEYYKFNFNKENF